MKAITLWQPWATLVALDAKTIETRSWPTAHRGPLAIHAGKLRDPDSLMLCLTEPFRSALIAGGVKHTDDLPFGAIVAVADLTGCYQFTPHNVPAEGEMERAFGNFTAGRWGWRLGNLRRLPEPITCRGSRQIWDVPEDVAARIAAVLGGGLPLVPVPPTPTPVPTLFP